MGQDHTAESIFGGVAELYEQFRPEYPEQLVTDVLEWSDLPAEGRILEIGCGTGKATRFFGARGYSMTCLDPSAGMLAVARRVCAGFPNVEFVETKLEDWPTPGRLFDLAFSAQAFHWIDPKVGLPGVVDNLRANGAFAVFWHRQERPETAVRAAIDDAYTRFASDLKTPAPGVHGMRTAELIESSGLFGPIETRGYPWRAEYSAETWVNYLVTNSDHQALPKDRLQQLVEAIRAAIESHGGSYGFNVETQLLLCRKA